MKALLIGGGGREHALALSIIKSGAELITISPNKNPGLARVSKKFYIFQDHDTDFIRGVATRYKPDCIFIGPETPLASGVSDVLISDGFRVFAPSSKAAKLETSKAFLRILMKEKGIEGGVDSASFTDLDKARKYVDAIDYDFVIKPDGLTGGKGVMVQGTHFNSREEGIAVIGKYLGSNYSKILIERKVEGEEFSLQALVFNDTIHFFPIVQDYKRAYEGDSGPNTGGMGSISFSTRGLPFIPPSHITAAQTILRKIVLALAEDGINYTGPIYGQFMSTSEGPKVIEINARMGDPEGINVLSLLNDSIMDVAISIFNRGSVRLSFRDSVSILRYLVPIGYGQDPNPSKILVNEELLISRGLRFFFASVNSRGKYLIQTKSRSLAILSEDNNLEGALTKFQGLEDAIRGDYYMRKDIGNADSITRKRTFMQRLAGPF